MIREREKTKTKTETQAARDNRGVTIIELLIGISVLAVVGLMVSQLFGSSARMYHSTIFYADVQTESQSVSRRLSGSIMNASSLFLEETDEGLVLFTGKLSGSSGGDLYWFNKTTGCLYMNLGFITGNTSGLSGKPELTSGVPGPSDGLSAGTGQGETEEETYLTVETVRDAIENSSSDAREYLISDKIKELEISLTPALDEMKRKEGTYYYSSAQKVTVNYTITLKYLDSSDYTVSSSTTPRNHIDSLRWNPLDRESPSGAAE